MLYNGLVERGFSLFDVGEVLSSGLPLDFATAGYFVILVWLFALIGSWIRIPACRTLHLLYIGLVSVLLALIFVADCCLYTFWDFKIDATIFNYLDTPEGITSSVSVLYLVVAFVVTLVFALLFFFVLRCSLPRVILPIKRRVLSTSILLVFGGILFYFIRGGVGKATANTGMVYYSSHQFLNHSAVNPVFSIFSMIGKTQEFEKKGNYYPEQQRAQLFSELQYNTQSEESDSLLNTSRPNVLVILMEGFGGTFVEPLGGEPGVTPHFNRLSTEGVFFTNCYANSFRTDRGTVCTFSGYPSFPDVSVMKVPEKNRTLPGIASSLSAVGYSTNFVYGGDVNFTNMQSYLRATGYQNVVGDKSFTAEERKTHGWGVTDRIMFDYMYQQLVSNKSKKPWHTAFLTLASHDPWMVPYHRIKNNEVANSMAYLDDCLGKFVARLRKTPQWKDLLIICLPDHGIEYPKGLTELEKRKYHIPMLWLGGAVKQPRKIEQLCNQTDLAATLLGQMGLRHDAFRFSRDVMSKTYRYPCAFHTFGNGFSFIDSTGYSVFDVVSQRTIKDAPSISPRRIDLGKALLQTSYDDLGKR
ncbi:MAG: sulfatase-like hydrolase/transferase [Bacteroidaceae bacterium]